MRVKVKDLEVGMIIKCPMSEIKILSFEPSTFQKNGKEWRRAKIKSFGLADWLNDYHSYRIYITGLGKMETQVNVVINSNNFNN